MAHSRGGADAGPQTTSPYLHAHLIGGSGGSVCWPGSRAMAAYASTTAESATSAQRSAPGVGTSSASPCLTMTANSGSKATRAPVARLPGDASSSTVRLLQMVDDRVSGGGLGEAPPVDGQDRLALPHDDRHVSADAIRCAAQLTDRDARGVPDRDEATLHAPILVLNGHALRSHGRCIVRGRGPRMAAKAPRGSRQRPSARTSLLTPRDRLAGLWHSEPMLVFAHSTALRSARRRCLLVVRLSSERRVGWRR